VSAHVSLATAGSGARAGWQAGVESKVFQTRPLTGSLPAGRAAQEAEVAMNAFIVDGQNKPGELGRLAGTLADRGINITAISAATCGSTGSVALITNDEAGARSALQGSGFKFREIEAVSTGLEDRPGSLAEAARSLGEAGINIEALLPTGMAGNKVTSHS
jgi:hypothetical protein